jgi:hypothetical protein
MGWSDMRAPWRVGARTVSAANAVCKPATMRSAAVVRALRVTLATVCRHPHGSLVFAAAAMCDAPHGLDRDSADRGLMMKFIALEEHFILPKEEQNLPPGAHRGNDREKLLGFDVVAELLNLSDTRLAAMDAAGIDVQPARLSGARRRRGDPDGEGGQRSVV